VIPAGDIDFEVCFQKPRNMPPAKTYAIRLRCMHHESPNGAGHVTGDEDQWLVVEDHHEPLQQVLETSWDFTCPIHGAQREYPLEAKETDAGFKIRFGSGPGTIDPLGPFLHEAKSVPKPRREPRIQKKFRVWVRGMDSNGNAFRQSAQSLDVSRSGARLDGLGMLTLPGTTIEVRRQWRKALFRIVWVGKRGTAEASHVGIVCLEPSKNVWNIPEDN
jgi:hypothetical protein